MLADPTVKRPLAVTTLWTPTNNATTANSIPTPHPTLAELHASCPFVVMVSSMTFMARNVTVDPDATRNARSCVATARLMPARSATTEFSTTTLSQIRAEPTVNFLSVVMVFVILAKSVMPALSTHLIASTAESNAATEFSRETKNATTALQTTIPSQMLAEAAAKLGTVVTVSSIPWNPATAVRLMQTPPTLADLGANSQDAAMVLLTAIMVRNATVVSVVDQIAESFAEMEDSTPSNCATMESETPMFIHLAAEPTAPSHAAVMESPTQMRNAMMDL